MFKHAFFSAQPLAQYDSVYAALRILTGLLMAYHGWEVFDAHQMGEYEKWLAEAKFPMPLFMAYLAKGAELAAGISLTLGLWTRLGALATILTMLGITFWLGNGKFWYGDQHPFMFVMFGVLFFWGGPGKWSLDGRNG